MAHGGASAIALSQKAANYSREIIGCEITIFIGVSRGEIASGEKPSKNY
jgi:hypothetical protein